jgi:hypothetical protein
VVLIATEWTRRKKVAVIVCLILIVPMVAAFYIFELLGWVEVKDQ